MRSPWKTHHLPFTFVQELLSRCSLLIDGHGGAIAATQISNLMHQWLQLPSKTSIRISDRVQIDAYFLLPFFCTKLVPDLNQTFPRSVCPHKCERPLLSTVERWSLWNAKSQYVGCWIPIVSHTSYVSLMLHIKRVNYWTLMPTSNHMLSWVKDTAIATAKSLARATLRYFVRLY